MKRNFLRNLFLTLLATFAVGKMGFMAYNTDLQPHSMWDFLNVWFHGLMQDMCTAALFLIIPAILYCCALKWKQLPIRKILIPYYILAGTVIAVITVADTVMYEFWKFKLSAVVLSYAAYPEGSTSSVSPWFIASRVGSILILLAVIVTLLISFTPKRLKDGASRQNNTIMAFIAACMFYCLGTQPPAYFGDSLYLCHAAVNPVYNFAQSFYPFKTYETQYKFFSAEECTKKFDGLYPADTEDITDTLLNTKRPNILIIFMESFGGKFIKELGGLPDVSPNISKLIPEGVFWDHYYSNSFRTDRGTASAFSGYISYPDVSLMPQSEFHQMLSSLPRTLNGQGYSTHYLYPGAMTNMGKRKFLEVLNFQDLLDYTYFDKRELDSSWGAHDGNSSQKTLEWVKQQSGEQPWLMVYQTISSHEPFDVPYKRLEDKVQNAFAYTDQCVGTLIDGLKQLPQWQNLLVIIIPDHGYLYQQTLQDPEFFHSPMLWVGGAVRNARTMHQLMNQSDLSATLLSQLGISHEDFPWSRNVLSKQYTHPFVYCNYPAGFMFADQDGCTMYDLTANECVYDDGKEPDAQQRRMEHGQAILQTSYQELATEAKK